MQCPTASTLKARRAPPIQIKVSNKSPVKGLVICFFRSEAREDNKYPERKAVGCSLAHSCFNLTFQCRKDILPDSYLSGFSQANLDKVFTFRPCGEKE